MNEHRTAARWFAGLVLASAAVIGGTAPAQADTGWNGTVAPAHSPASHRLHPSDTGWNGT